MDLESEHTKRNIYLYIRQKRRTLLIIFWLVRCIKDQVRIQLSKTVKILRPNLEKLYNLILLLPMIMPV